jgi:hypothetical protein
MSIIVGSFAIILIAGVAYSSIKKITSLISESLIYKDTPYLLGGYNKYNEKYKEAKVMKCYGEMARLANNMIKIKKEVESRVIDTRMENVFA